MSCELGNVLKNYVHPLMQLLTNDIKEFNMGLLTTKCLNTAVMIMYFMAGKRGVKASQVCDCATIRETSLLKADPYQNTRVCKSLARAILDEATTRELIYILITDADFDNHYFPGHVIVIEKFPNKTYHMYQSYINQYDLNGYHEHNKSFVVHHERMQSILRSLYYVMCEADTWDENCVQIWKDITFVDTSSMLGTYIKNRFFLCFKKMKALHCIKNIERYAKKKLRSIPDNNEVYGNTALYSRTVRALTNSEIKHHLQSLVPDIKRYKY